MERDRDKGDKSQPPERPGPVARPASREEGQRLRAERMQAELVAIVESSEDAIIGKTLQGIVTSWNPAAERMYGWTAEEMVGKSLSTIFPPARVGELASILERIGRNEPLQHYETVRRRKDGTLIDVSISVSPIRDPSGRIVGAATIARDISERRQAEAERERLLQRVKENNERLVEATLRARDLAEEAQRRAAELDTTISSMVDGIVIYGPEGEIAKMNPAAEALLGYSQSQWRLPLPERLGYLNVTTAQGAPFPADETPTARALGGESTQGVVMVLQRPEGPRRWVSVGAAPIRGVDGRILGAVATFTDITPLHELQEQREDLVRTVSHDLRSPLTAVQGQAQLLQRLLERSGQDGQLRQSAEAIVVGARRMNAMIQDLVDMARVESRQLRLSRTAVDLRSFLLDLNRRLADVLDTRRIRVEIPEEMPRAYTDPDRLERIMTNLLSNALKYSPADSVVKVTARAVDGEVEVSVSDHGVGIPDEDCPHLFERFYRIKGTRKAEGLGLGLYITRMLVEAQGGRIWVESREGQGSSFSFTMPRAGSSVSTGR